MGNIIDIVSLIPEGKENAISTPTLMKLLNCVERDLRELIEAERNKGAVICSSSKGGYYRPALEELKESIATLDKRAKSIFRALRSQKKALKDYDNEGQERLPLEA